AGTSYLIKVADYGGPNGGTLVFHFSYAAAPPANDLCSSATLISSNTFSSTSICTLRATTTANEPAESCGAPPNGHSVCFRFVPTVGGAADADTFGSNFDTVLSIFSGSCAAANLIACNDDTGGVASSLSNVPMTAGTTYLLKVTAYSTDEGGSLHLNFAYQTNGDLNCDGSVTAADLPAFIDALLGNGANPACARGTPDMDGNGITDGRDIMPFVAAIIQ